jgi:hypothetical protein
LGQIPITLANGRAISFEVDLERDGPAFFALSVRKCGSSIFNMISKALGRASGYNWVDMGGDFFKLNIMAREYLDDPAIAEIIRPGNAYGGFRDFPSAFLKNESFRNDPKIFFIRDPRDALVSQYFSDAYSHPVPKATAEGDTVTRHIQRQRQSARDMSIDEYVIANTRAMARTMMSYKKIMDLPALTLLRYEDNILDKTSMMRAIGKAFGWRTDDQLIGLILNWADVRPEQENPTAFVRKVTPGDHRDKLTPETIERLNEELREPMELFGYR